MHLIFTNKPLPRTTKNSSITNLTSTPYFKYQKKIYHMKVVYLTQIVHQSPPTIKNAVTFGKLVTQQKGSVQMLALTQRVFDQEHRKLDILIRESVLSPNKFAVTDESFGTVE